jgi:hypothetical protein
LLNKGVLDEGNRSLRFPCSHGIAESTWTIMCSYLGGSGHRIDVGKSEVGVEEKCWVKGSSVFF